MIEEVVTTLQTGHREEQQYSSGASSGRGRHDASRYNKKVRQILLTCLVTRAIYRPTADLVDVDQSTEAGLDWLGSGSLIPGLGLAPKQKENLFQSLPRQIPHRAQVRRYRPWDCITHRFVHLMKGRIGSRANLAEAHLYSTRPCPSHLERVGPITGRGEQRSLRCMSPNKNRRDTILVIDVTLGP